MTKPSAVREATIAIRVLEKSVVVCEQCNQRQSDRTPLEASMSLCTQPKAPVHPALSFAEQFWREQQAHLELGGTTRPC